MRSWREISLWLVVCLLLLGWSRMAAAQRNVLASLEQDITGLVESVKPSLVTIETGSRIGTAAGSKGAASTFVGSGIIYSEDGYILTSASVASGMGSFKITLPDGRAVDGKMVGTDEESNLAVLKVDAVGLKPATLGNSDGIKVGSWLTVVGNSYGLPNAVALGLVNGLRDDGFIQMSANVSPGNSGGPVMDTYGRVIGLVAAKLSEPSYISAVQIYDNKMATITIPPRQIEIPSSGVSLALPINRVRMVADEIIKEGSVRRGYLGIYPQNLPSILVKKTGSRSGILVADVVQGSPAERAGLKDGDIIVEFAGTQVVDQDQIRKLIRSKKADEAVQLKIFRDDQSKELTVTLGTAKPSYSNIWDIPEPQVPQHDLDEAYSYMKQVQDKAATSKGELQLLRDQVKSLSDELKRLSREMESLKAEKGKE